MNSKVYFVKFKSKIGNVLDKIDELFSAARFDSVIDEGDRVAVKLHFGEYGNFRQVRPTFAARIVRNAKRLGGCPFLTDANCLGGSRKEDFYISLLVFLLKCKDSIGYSKIFSGLFPSDFNVHSYTRAVWKILDKMIEGYLMNDRRTVCLIKVGIRVRLRRDIIGDCL